ncbi:MAG: TolC family protein [Pseudomonadota bacterium]
MRRRLSTRLLFLGLGLALATMPPAGAGELRDILEATLTHPQLRARAGEVDAARAEQRAAGSRYLGQGSLSAGWQRYEGERVVGVFVPTPNSTVPLAREIGQYGVSYSLPVDVFGVIAAARTRAAGDLGAARLLARQEMLLKLHQAASAYATLQALQRQQEALARLRDSVTASHRRVQEEFVLGRAAGVDLRLAESELARVQADEAGLAAAVANAQAELLEASGREAGWPMTTAIRVPAWHDGPLQQSLPVRLAEAREASSAAQARERRRALWPALSLDASYYTYQGGGATSDVWSLGGKVALPLDASAWHRVSAQDARAQAARDEARAAERDTRRQLQALRANYDGALADARALEQEVRYRREVLAVQRERWRLGALTLENLLRQERDLLDAEYRLANAQARAADAWSAAQVIAGLPAAAYIAQLDAP